MKKSLYSLLAVAAVLCGCQSNESLDVKAPSGKKMTLTASIPSSRTKVVYEEAMTDAGIALKAAWSDRDTISVVSYGIDGMVLSIDEFVCEGAAGQTKAVFTGTLTSEDAISVVAVYPKLKQYDYEGDVYYSNESGTVEVYEDEPYIYMYSFDSFVEEPSEMERLANAAVLLGKVSSVEDDELSVELEHQHLLIKVVFDASEYVGRYLNYFEMDLIDSNWEEKAQNIYAIYNVLKGECLPVSDPNYPEMTLLHGTSTGCSHVVAEDGTLTVYLMLFPEQVETDDFFFCYVGFEAEGDEDEGPFTYGFSYDITRSLSLEAGKVYTLGGFVI